MVTTRSSALALSKLSLLISQCRTGSLQLPVSSQRVITMTAVPPARGAPVPTAALGSLADDPITAGSSLPGFVDIGANLLDPMFAGEYRGKRAHEPDLHAVLQRAAQAGVRACMVTAGSLHESREALALVRRLRAGCPVALYCTAGVHPTRAIELLPQSARDELAPLIEAVSAVARTPAAQLPSALDDEPSVAAEAAVAEGSQAERRLLEAERRLLATAEVREAIDQAMDELREILLDGVSDGSIAAIGECGLDYARLHFTPALVQRAGFEAQLGLAERLAAEVGRPLPLFLHNRDSASDLAECLGERRALRGVVHSFDGDESSLRALLDLGLEIGINGCSLRSQENLHVSSLVPLEKLHLETDAPWCGIRRTHAGARHVRPLPHEERKKDKWEQGCIVKDRSEPAHISQVLEVVAAARNATGEETREICAAALANSQRLFGLANL